MSTTIRARIRGGVIEPLEQVDLPEGQDIMVTILTLPSPVDAEVFHLSAGRWRGSFDPEKFIDQIYATRLVSPRPAPTL